MDKEVVETKTMKVNEEIKPTNTSRQIERQEPRTLRELDIAIAERVMRWPRRDNDDGKDYAGTFFSAYNDGGQIIVFKGGSQRSAERWTPAQDIAAAMEVVEKMRERGYQVSIRSWEGAVPWSVKFISYTSKEEVEEDGDSLPEAIGRAALSLVAVQNNEGE